jgi:putative Mg2+ transporter-C (MgtC) family protein
MLEPFLRLLWAAALAFPIGLDRELRGKPAGLRTHVVVATASAALGYVSVAAAGVVGADQTRIAAQVVTGIGFMGAGIIFATGGRVHGLTTAAALWSAMAVGLAVGLGADALAVALVLVTMTFLWPVDWLMSRLLATRNRADRVLHLAGRDWSTIASAHELLIRNGGLIRDLEIDQEADMVAARLTVGCTDSTARLLLKQLNDLYGVVFAVMESIPESVTRPVAEDD